ncbi:MAG TPA: hypothetical protein DCZ02_03280 [Ruminococcaceae bacterium]|nr:hypothetical protein [Oscillospiraceae bacterium]
MTDLVKNISVNVTDEKPVEKERLTFNELVWIFFISCEVGWAVETLWCLIKHGYIESRQSLVYSHLSVAYGMGAVILTLVLFKLRESKLINIFLVSFIAGTVTEYICSLGQEILFGSVAWDYSNVPLNINGRVCLLYSLFWGVLGIAWIKGIYPLLSKFVSKIPKKFSQIFVICFAIFFIFDAALSGAAAFRMDERNAGVPADNVIAEYLDNNFDDERMHKIYANSKDV